MNQEKEEIYVIPMNYSGMGRVAGFKIRNITEGIIVALFALKMILGIPFVLKVKIIVIVLVCLAILVLFATGIKNESITQFIISYLQFYIKKRRYIFRVPSEITHVQEQEEGEPYESYYERFKKRFFQRKAKSE